MVDRYQGDPKITVDGNGSDLVFKGGQPVMDQGLENAAIISLHTREGWCGNVFARNPEEKIGSKFEVSQEQPITLTSLNTIRNAALLALQWMVDRKIAAGVDASVSNPTGMQLHTMVVITPPSRDPLILINTKNGSNWINQKLDPASSRI